MAPEPGQPDVPSTLHRHVEHVLSCLFRPGELEEWQFRWEREADSGRVMLLVDGVACGESFAGYVGEVNDDFPLDDGWWMETFADGLEDFVSESRFAWGQQRLLIDRPWRSVQDDRS
jgi:hypothetical protein